MHLRYFNCRLYICNYSTFGLNGKYYYKVQNKMSLSTCRICDSNSIPRTCCNCQVKCCEPCLVSHQTSCSGMKDHHYHMCIAHGDQQVDYYCQQCLQLICENCRSGDHTSHVILRMKTALDNCREYMPKVGHELNTKYDQLKRSMAILEKDNLLSQQTTGTSIKATNQHSLESLHEAITNFDFMKKESFPITVLSKWTYVIRALNKYNQLQSPATESQQSNEQMSSRVSDVNNTSRNLVT